LQFRRRSGEGVCDIVRVAGIAVEQLGVTSGITAVGHCDPLSIVFAGGKPSYRYHSSITGKELTMPLTSDTLDDAHRVAVS
jgi:hypothetical protein